MGLTICMPRMNALRPPLDSPVVDSATGGGGAGAVAAAAGAWVRGAWVRGAGVTAAGGGGAAAGAVVAERPLAMAWQMRDAADSRSSTWSTVTRCSDARLPSARTTVICTMTFAPSVRSAPYTAWLARAWRACAVAQTSSRQACGPRVTVAPTCFCSSCCIRLPKVAASASCTPENSTGSSTQLSRVCAWAWAGTRPPVASTTHTTHINDIADITAITERDPVRRRWPVPPYPCVIDASSATGRSLASPRGAAPPSPLGA